MDELGKDKLKLKKTATKKCIWWLASDAYACGLVDHIR